MMLKLAKALRRFRRGEDGAATIEFCILFPAFVAIMLASIEAGVMMVRNVMLERGVDIAVRDLRLGNPIDASLSGEDRYKLFKQTVCDNAIIYVNCLELVQVELQPVSTATWSPLVGAENCINEATHNADINPVNPYNPALYQGGENNELMLVRVCGLFTPFFITTRLGMEMPIYDPDPNDEFQSDKYALIVTSAFVNEPSR